MKRPLILVGGGGHCKSVIEAAESAGYTIKGILDIPEQVGKKVLGYTIMGTDNDISSFVAECDFMVTLGFIKNPKVRISLHDKIEMAGGQLAIVIASTAHVSKYAELGMGTVVLHQACVNAGAKIEKGCIINTFANIEHDTVIGDYCHISTGAMINGDCSIGKKTFVGSHSVISNGVSIGCDCIIGAGSTIVKNINDGYLYIGNPLNCTKNINVNKYLIGGGKYQLMNRLLILSYCKLIA